MEQANANTFGETLPAGFHLLPNERLVHIETVRPRTPPEKSSSLHEIYRLTGASSDSEVGAFGPAVAALAFESDEPAPLHQGLYSVVFGRDSLRVALDLVDHYPRLTRATVKKLAETQGVEFNDTREEEPGRIAHEIRESNDPIAQQLTEQFGWDWPYYGSVDATPEFIRTISAYCQLHDENGSFLFDTYVDKHGQEQPIHVAFSRALDWLTMRLDENPQGLLEYQSSIPAGIENQVWKDSWDAYHHADGSIANHSQGIASVEVQGVAHDALLDAADIYERVFCRDTYAEQLRERAARLSETVRSLFWTEDKGGYFVLGLDYNPVGELRQLKVRTSNMGHLLNSRILDGMDEESTHKRAAILRQLQNPGLLAPAGIRTLASDEVRFREGAYHNGSVWLWDTHHIAKGARRHTADPAFISFADLLDERVIKATRLVGGFPEYVRGGNTIDINRHIIDVEDLNYHRVHRIEQPPQEVQAWTVAAVLSVKRRAGHLVLAQ